EYRGECPRVDVGGGSWRRRVGGHANRTFCGFCAFGMMMRSKRYCRPKRQQKTNDRRTFNGGPHLCTLRMVFFEIYTERYGAAIRIKPEYRFRSSRTAVTVMP